MATSLLLFSSMVQIILCIYFLLLSYSCGKQKFPDYDEKPELEQREEADGHYSAKFSTLNPSLTGSIDSHSIMWVKGRQFYIKIATMKIPAGHRYQQYIHYGDQCPDRSSDLNRDGKIDLFEVRVSSGEMLIPLDRSLKSQSIGGEWFPFSDSSGMYYYSRAVSVIDMLRDLRLPDRFPNDGLTKLKRNEELNLDQRTIIIYGTPSDPLLPIACAEINEDMD